MEEEGYARFDFTGDLAIDWDWLERELDTDVDIVDSEEEEYLIVRYRERNEVLSYLKENNIEYFPAYQERI